MKVKSAFPCPSFLEAQLLATNNYELLYSLVGNGFAWHSHLAQPNKKISIQKNSYTYLTPPTKHFFKRKNFSHLFERTSYLTHSPGLTKTKKNSTRESLKLIPSIHLRCNLNNALLIFISHIVFYTQLAFVFYVQGHFYICDQVTFFSLSHFFQNIYKYKLFELSKL